MKAKKATKHRKSLGKPKAMKSVKPLAAGHATYNIGTVQQS